MADCISSDFVATSSGVRILLVIYIYSAQKNIIVKRVGLRVKYAGIAPLNRLRYAVFNELRCAVFNGQRYAVFNRLRCAVEHGTADRCVK